MEYITEGIKEAFHIIICLDRNFLEIVFVSMKVAFISTFLGVIVGVPFGIMISLKKFAGKRMVITVLNTLMSLPTVLVGLILYSFLSRRGPWGDAGLLFTLSAMVLGQFILIFPIIAGLTITAIKGLDRRVLKTIISLGADRTQGLRMFIFESRYAILAAIVAGFGRVFSEVGISMMLGGNIKGYTRSITTAIALETSKGEFSLGIALGLVLLTVALGVNIIFSNIQKKVKNELF